MMSLISTLSCILRGRLRIQWMLFAMRILRSTRSAQFGFLGVRRLCHRSSSGVGVTAPNSLVAWDDIMDALRALDKEDICKPLPHYKRVLAQKGRGLLLGATMLRRRNRNDQGAPLN